VLMLRASNCRMRLRSLQNIAVQETA